jgi:predicted Zn-dependent protease
MRTVDPRHPLIAAGTLGLVLALGFTACQKVPYTGRQQVVAMSLDAEATLGADAFTEILAAETVIPSGDLASQVAQIAGGITRRAPAPYSKLAWDTRLIHSESVNAFALPGGKIGVYTGILPVLANEAGLGSVLGHEVGHVVARHSAERITGVMALQTALSAADIALSSTEMHDELMGLLGLGATVGVVLPFSRANELEADYLGGIFMAKNGLDPQESWKVWERMTALGGDSPIAIFSTHPSNTKRIERLKEEMPTFEKHYRSASSKRGRGNDLRIDLVPAGPPPTAGGKKTSKGDEGGDTTGDAPETGGSTTKPGAENLVDEKPSGVEGGQERATKDGAAKDEGTKDEGSQDRTTKDRTSKGK